MSTVLDRAGRRPQLPPGPAMIAGLARAGAAAAEALGGRAVVAWDASEREAVAGTAAALRERGITVAVGGDGIELLDGETAPRWLVKSPGIPLEARLIAAARGRGLSVLDELELGWRLEPRPLVAITGTNGKSTVAALFLAILGAAGIDAALAGNTRFGPPLSAAVQASGEVVVCEVSSFQLEGCEHFLPEVALLTNLTHDHLYRHGSRARYEELKASMFRRRDRVPRAAVLCADDCLGARLAAELRSRDCEVRTFGMGEDADWCLRSASWTLDGAEVGLAAPRGHVTVATRLPGLHNALNVTAALALSDACAIDPEPALEVVRAFAGVPGRFQRIATRAGAEVIVDYAHNPAGVESALSTAASIVRPRSGRVLAVVASLPFYDAEMQRAIGAAAARHADRITLTTERIAADSPPAPTAELRAGAQSGAATVEIVPERLEAIAAALAGARRGDLVLVLGRGEGQGPLYEPSGALRRKRDAELVEEALRVLEA